MFKLWFYGVLIRYYKYCFKCWLDILENDERNEIAENFCHHYGKKILSTYKKSEAYRRYIEILKIERRSK